jgi:ABC-type multidrug transport system fused ATPase/permease subunit
MIKMRGSKAVEEESETKVEELDMPKHRTFFEKIWRNYINGFRRNILARLFYTFLLFKQLCYAIIFVFVTGKEAQLSLFIIATFFYLLYIIIVRPFEHLVQNIISLVNEFIVLLCAFLMIAFLDDGEQKTGFATAIIVLFSITIIGSFVISIIFQIYQLCQRRKRSKVEKEAEINESNIHMKNNDMKGIEESPYESRDEPIMNESGLPPIHKKRGEETSRFEEIKDESFKDRQDSLGLGDSDRKSKLDSHCLILTIS